MVTVKWLKQLLSGEKKLSLGFDEMEKGKRFGYNSVNEAVSYD